MKRAVIVMAILTVVALITGGVWAQIGRGLRGSVNGPEPKAMPEVRAILTAPPLVPPPVDRKGPAKIIVALETREAKGKLANDVEYTFWTFGGTVPGPFIRVRVGDTVQIRLKGGSSTPRDAPWRKAISPLTRTRPATSARSTWSSTGALARS